MELTRDRAGRPWRARQREVLSRIVRETESPTDSLPRITDRERGERDDSYDTRIGEVLDLAGTIGAILMASSVARSMSSTRRFTSPRTVARPCRRPAHYTSCSPGRWTSADWRPLTA